MADYSEPKRGVAFSFDICLEARSQGDTFQVNPTIASGDFKVSKDNGALANLNTLPSVSPAGGKIVNVVLSATEMTADKVTVICSDAAGEEWKDQVIEIRPATVQTNDVYTIVNSGTHGNAALKTLIDTVDTVADAIKAKTDSLTFTVAGQVDANVQYVNDVQVTGAGAPGDEWGP